MAGAAAALAGLHPLAAHAEDDFLLEVFNILSTGEKLNVVFYSMGVANRNQLGFTDTELASLQAILVEEQIHNHFAELNGGVAVTTRFSFPLGAMTFTDRASFLATMQGIEDVTNGALLALIKDFADRSLGRYAQFAGQLMQVEGGHRAVNRALRNAYPLEDWAFGPVTIAHFQDVPGVVAKAGFLSPTAGNDYAYQPVSMTLSSVTSVGP
jgi:ferritin-like protein